MLENNRAPCGTKIISPDPDAPELPPPLRLDSQDTDTLSVYQDINESLSKPNNVVDCDKSTQDNNSEPVALL